MSEKEIKALALKIQTDLHNTFLNGFYFSEEDVEDIIKEWLEKSE